MRLTLLLEDFVEIFDLAIIFKLNCVILSVASLECYFIEAKYYCQEESPLTVELGLGRGLGHIETKLAEPQRQLFPLRALWTLPIQLL